VLRLKRTSLVRLKAGTLLRPAKPDNTVYARNHARRSVASRPVTNELSWKRYPHVRGVTSGTFVHGLVVAPRRRFRSGRGCGVAP